MKLALGIDVGGTSTKMGLVTQSGDLLAETVFPAKEYEEVSGFVDALQRNLKLLVDSNPEKIELIGIGIGAPNGNYFKGTIEYPPNLGWKGVTPLASVIKSHFKLPVLLTNDANAAAYGEMLFGGAVGMKDFIVITLGTGLGSGIVVNGRVLYGHDGFAGEIGHTLVNVHGRQCGCGRKGCLETYVSATGICRTVYKLLADFTGPSRMRGISFDELSAEMITDAAHHGDEVAMAAFEYTGRILGMKLADAVAHTSPEAIFLFGGLTKSRELLFMPTSKHFKTHLLNLYQGKVQLKYSGLNDKNAAILGSAAMIWKHYLEDRLPQ